MTEAIFLAVYGSPLLQAAGRARRRAGGRATGASSATWCARRPTAQLRAELERHFEVGGLPEAAVVRALIYVRLPDGSVDERGFAALQAIGAALPAASASACAELQGDAPRAVPARCALDEERAIAALPQLLPDDAAAARRRC